MKKLLIPIFLLGCLMLAACQATQTESGDIKPVIYSISPDKIESLGQTNEVSVALYGKNFGPKSENTAVYYTGSALNSSQTHKTRLEFINGGSWSENLINVVLYKKTLEDYPKGRFSVYSNGSESELSQQEFYYNPTLNNALVTAVSPKEIYSYDLEKNLVITITGSGFGSAKQNLALYNMNTSSRSRVVEPFIYSDTSISFFYPSDFKHNFNTAIGIKAEKSNTFLTYFNYIAPDPEISYISSSSADNTFVVGDIITVHSRKGGWGSKKPESFYCAVNRVAVNEFILYSDNAITFKIPDCSSVVGEAVHIDIAIYNKQLTSSFTLKIGPYIDNAKKIEGSWLSAYTYEVTGYGFTNSSIICIEGVKNDDFEVSLCDNTKIRIRSSSSLQGKRFYIKPFNGSKMCSNKCYFQ